VNHRAMTLLAMGSLALALALMPQSTAQAKTCYDSSKNVIPCPQSNYKQTQQAKKANGPSDTPVLPTKTLTPTPTDTQTSTPTITPSLTSTPSPTNQPSSTATQSAAQLIVPVNVPTQPNACDPRIWPVTAGFGVLLALTGIAIRVRSATQGTSVGNVASGYTTESKANAKNLDVHIGRVDFGDGNGGEKPSTAGPIALTTSGIALVLGSAAGLLNLIPCSAWIAAIGGGVVVGLATVMITRVLGK